MFIKGEWETFATENFGGAFVSYIICGGKCIAQTTLVINEATEEENTANAHLIAAAPDMYEALKGVKEWFLFTGVHAPLHGATEGNIDKALAKVEGK